MNIPDEYKTGNKKIDEKIEMAFRKNPLRPNQLQRIMDNSLPDDKENKYGVAEKADRTYKDGTVFASKREMDRWDYLLNLQRAGEIKDLKRQVPFVLQEEFISRQHGEIKAITYVADFTYINIRYRKGFEGREVVEDSKGGMRTVEYRNKRKNFLYKYGELLFFEV